LESAVLSAYDNGDITEGCNDDAEVVGSIEPSASVISESAVDNAADDEEEG